MGEQKGTNRAATTKQEKKKKKKDLFYKNWSFQLMWHRESVSMMPLWTFNWEEQVHEPSCPRMEGFDIKWFKNSHKHMAACGVSGAPTDCLCCLICACCYIADICLLVNVINIKLTECILTAGVMLLEIDHRVHICDLLLVYIYIKFKQLLVAALETNKEIDK